jgi:hypothetical protein
MRDVREGAMTMGIALHEYSTNSTHCNSIYNPGLIVRTLMAIIVRMHTPHFCIMGITPAFTVYIVDVCRMITT